MELDLRSFVCGAAFGLALVMVLFFLLLGYLDWRLRRKSRRGFPPVVNQSAAKPGEWELHDDR